MQTMLFSHHSLWRLCLFCLFIGFVACKKSSPGNARPAVEPVVTQKGTPVGAAVKKSIGSAGGSLTSADGKITVTIPAGTVTADTEFGIQPITNTLLNDPTKPAYRLTPEGITFSKPVEVSFGYSEADTDGTLPELLMVAYQTDAGTWKAVPVSLDKTDKKVTITTTHFSDWELCATVDLEPEKQQVIFRESIKITIKGMFLNDDNLLAPLEPLAPAEFKGWINKVDWRLLTSAGFLTTNNDKLNEVEFTADHPQGPNTVAEIAAEMTGDISVLDKTAPNGRRTFKQLTLLTSVQVLGDVYMVGSFGDKINLTEGVTALYANGRIHINGHSPQISIGLEAFGPARTAAYPCGDPLVPGNSRALVSFNMTGEGWGHSYLQCPGRVETYSSGTLTISQWGGVGEPVEGEFNGTLYTADQNGTGGQCPTYKTKNLSVRFRTIRGL